jgi:lysophospholipase L1-like esterase
MKKNFMTACKAGLIALITWGCNPNQNIVEMEQPYQYLALGDSYTIGEGVGELERYPNQLVQKLAIEGIQMEQPTIIATTGWTTDELQAGIEKENIDGNKYDLVTLLIGVNNQYRGRDLDNFEEEFSGLLQQAIDFAGGNKDHVIVLSIPDWGVTPFAEEKNADKAKVAEEIDAFNRLKEKITSEAGVHFIDITEDYRQRGHLPEGVVNDLLHPSGMIYESWAAKVINRIKSQGILKG